MVCKQGGKIKATQRWRMNEQNTEVADEFNYLGVVLESTGGQNKHRILAKTNRYQAPVGTDKCISATPNNQTLKKF